MIPLFIDEPPSIYLQLAQVQPSPAVAVANAMANTTTKDLAGNKPLAATSPPKPPSNPVVKQLPIVITPAGHQ